LERIDAATLSRADYLLNGHQDVVELRNSAGNILNKYTYDIWGKPLTETEMVSNPFRYSSELWDSKAKLLYLSVRWYDTNTARFLEEDTFEGELKNPLSLNLYTYAHNNPNSYSDPTGNFVFLIPIAMYVAKVAIKTATDVAFDYAASKVTGEKFSLRKNVGRNLISNAIPGLGEAKTISKVLKVAKVSKTVKGTNKGPYSHIKDSKNVGKGKDFTPAQKKKIIEENRKRNDGDVHSDQSSTKLVKPTKSRRGVTPPQNEWQIDHIVPRNKGGTNSYKNAQVLSRKENRDKWNR
jgi:RHS repeat-associated protein